MKVSAPRITHETPSHRTQNGYISKFRLSLTNWTAKSQDPSRDKTSLYASLINPTLWDKPSHSTRLCLHRNKVYELTCKACRKFYIGSTTRFLHDRVKEHLTNDNSSVKKHLTTCHHNTQNIEVKIITRVNDPANLRLYEAFYIRKHKPELNSREECSELRDLLF